MNLELVAMVDDDFSEDARIERQSVFQNAGIKTAFFTERETFEHSVCRGDFYDAIILDWRFLGETGDITRLILQNAIFPNLFVPIFVYTEHPEDAESDLAHLAESVDPSFKSIKVFSKDKVTPADLVDNVKSWYAASTSTKLAQVWRTARRMAFEQSLYTLVNIEGMQFERTLQHLLHLDAADINDVTHALEFLERFVSRRVFANNELRGALLNQLEESRKIKGFTLKGPREAALVNAHRYIPKELMGEMVQTGDLVQIVRTGAAVEPMIAIVVTPACDLDVRKCTELRLMLAKETTLESPRTEAEIILPSVSLAGKNEFKGLLINFHRTLFLIDKAFDDAPADRNGRAIAYSHDFIDTFGNVFRLEPICRLDDPYRSDLLQNFASHVSRIGIPNER